MTVQLTTLKPGQQAVITAVLPGGYQASVAVPAATLPATGDTLAMRLMTLGFIPGERVRLLAYGLFGQDPILVQLGFTRFALRQVEARRIWVEVQP